MSVKSKKSGGFGYTIVEVMIFLAVSGFMFLAAAVFINGKQAQATFQRGMDEAGANLTSLVNNISDGQFNLPETNFHCVSDVNSGSPRFTNSSGTGQGANAGCVFLGTVLDIGQTSDAYDTYTVVGRQFVPQAGAAGCTTNSFNVPVQKFCQAEPVTNGSNLKSSTKWGWGLSLKTAYLCNDSKCSGTTRDTINGIGLFSSLANSSGIGSASIGGIRGTGSQTVSVVSLTKLSVGNVVSNVADLSNAQYNALNGKPNILSGGQYILLCFASGDKIGSVTIGGSSGQLSSVSVSYNKGAC